MVTREVHLDEIFLSLQGEGGEVGKPHLFLRLAGCPLRCSYCDTPRSWLRRPQYSLYGPREQLRRDNPVPAARLDEELAWVAGEHGCAPAALTLAVTGGEPLAQVDFLEEWLPSWPGKVLLETAGLWPERLERLLGQVDFLSLDWKLPSTLNRGEALAEPGPCVEHLSWSGLEGWVKVVVTEQVVEEELAAALAAIAAAAPGCRVYLQPATPVPGGPRPPGAEVLLAWTVRYQHLPLDLRVLPQVHPLLGAR